MSNTISFTLEEVKQVLHALDINRIMAQDSEGNYTREVTPKIITKAIAVLKSASLRQAERELIDVKGVQISED